MKAKTTEKKTNLSLLKLMFILLMAISVLMVMLSLSGSAVFAEDDEEQDYIDAPTNFRFEGSYIRWNASDFFYQNEDEDDGDGTHTPWHRSSYDKVIYTITIYEVREYEETQLEQFKVTEPASLEYDLTDLLENYSEYGQDVNALRVSIRSAIVIPYKYRDEHGDYVDHPMESSEVSISGVPCGIVFLNKDFSVHRTDYAFEGWKAAKPKDPVQKGAYFLYWCQDRTLNHDWDFDRKIRHDDMTTGHTMFMYSKFAEENAHQHDGMTFKPWTSRKTLPNEKGNYYLTFDVELSSTWTTPSGDTSICMNGHTISRPSGGGGPVIMVSSGLSLYSDEGEGEGILRMADKTDSQLISSAVDIRGGTFRLNGVTIDGTAKPSSYYGGGVKIGGGLFEMNSGKITNCNARQGGGVYVSNSGTFRMNGGEISGCSAGYGGGVNVHKGKLEISGGTITHNRADNEGGGILFYPVSYKDASVTLIPAAGKTSVNDIIITGNEGGNLILSNGSDSGSNVYKLRVNAAISEGTRIGVRLYNNIDKKVPFTSGLAGRGTADNFTSDDGKYFTQISDDGEAGFMEHKHTWEFKEFRWDTSSDAKAVYECSTGIRHEGTLAAEVDLQMKDATCEESGGIIATAYVAAKDSLDGKEHSMSKVFHEEDAKGHNWGEAVYEWADDNSTVTAMRTCRRDDSHADKETVKAKSEVTREATCETGSEITYTAEFKNKAFEKQSVTVENNDAPGHDWGEWQVQEEPTASEAGSEIRFCKRDGCDSYDTRVVPPSVHVHDLKLVKEVKASCEKSGKKGYYECSSCGAWYKDSAGKVQVTGMDLLIPATGHKKGTPEKGEVTPAACSSVGGYNLTTRCSNCGKVLSIEHIVIPFDPDVHDWGEAVYEWADDNSEVTAMRTCKENESHVEKETAKTTSKVTKAATCEVNGETTYTAAFKNKAFAAQSDVVSNIAALGHDWGEWTMTKAATATEEGLETRTCKRNGCGEKDKRPVPPIGHEHYLLLNEEVKATCEHSGKKRYYECTGCSAWYADAEGTVQVTGKDLIIPLDPDGHDWGEWVVTTKPTAEAKGVEKRTCKNDPSHVEIRTISNEYYVAAAKAKNAKTNAFKLKAKRHNQVKLTVTSKVKGRAYQVRYSTSKKFSKRTTKAVTVKAGKKSIVLKKLKAKKKYYVQIRPVTKITNETTGETTSVAGKWSKRKAVKL